MSAAFGLLLVRAMPSNAVYLRVNVCCENSHPNPSSTTSSARLRDFDVYFANNPHVAGILVFQMHYSYYLRNEHTHTYTRTRTHCVDETAATSSSLSTVIAQRSSEYSHNTHYQRAAIVPLCAIETYFTSFFSRCEQTRTAAKAVYRARSFM